MGLTVQRTVPASTMEPVTVLLAPAAVLLDIMATPVNTVCKPSLITQKRNLVIRSRLHFERDMIFSVLP